MFAQRFACGNLSQGFQTSSGNGRRCSGRENVRPSTIREPVDEPLRTGDKPTVATVSFAQSTDADVNVLFDIHFLAKSATVLSKDAGRVGFVHQEHRTEFGCDFRQLLERREIAVHREERVRDDESPASLRGLWLLINAPPARRLMNPARQ